MLGAVRWPGSQVPHSAASALAEAPREVAERPAPNRRLVVMLSLDDTELVLPRAPDDAATDGLAMLGCFHLRYVSRVGLSAQFHPRVHRVQVQRLPRVSRCRYGAASVLLCRRVVVVASCGCACSVSWPSTWRVFMSGPPRPRRNDRSCNGIWQSTI